MSFFTLSDHFLLFWTIFKNHAQRMEKNQLMQKFYAETLEKKDLLKNMKCSRSLLDPEHCQCGHQQPYNFFSVFIDFLATHENQNQSIRSKIISCNRVIFSPIISKGKTFRADRKKFLFYDHYWWDGTSNYIYSTISVITKVYIFVLYLQFYYW